MTAELDESVPIRVEKKKQETEFEREKREIEFEEENPFGPLVIGQFMKIAKGFEEQGDIHQAIGIYNKIIKEYPDAKEAGESRLALYTLAEKQLREGDVYSAMALFEKVV